MYRGLKIAAVVPAAGKGSRMNTDISKQYLMLGDKPVLVHTLQALEKCRLIDGIVVVAAQGEIEYCRKIIVEKYNLKKVTGVLPGGDTRQQSVERGVDATKSDIVIVHDGARPFLNNRLIEEGIRLLVEGEYQGTGCAVPVKDTVKMVDREEVVKETLPREYLRAVQTPQFFCRSVLHRVHKEALAEGTESTDDLMLLERYGYSVKLFRGSYSNIKITTPVDMALAEIILKGGEYDV